VTKKRAVVDALLEDHSVIWSPTVPR